MHPSAGPLSYSAFPGMVLIVLPLLSIFCPVIFSIGSELKGNGHGVDLNRMEVVLSLHQSYGGREDLSQDSFRKAAHLPLLPGVLAQPVAIRKTGFRMAAAGCFPLHSRASCPGA